MPIDPTSLELIQKDWEQACTRYASDPRSSAWLRQVLSGVLARDPFDSANEAELLAAVLRGRFNEECFGDPFAHARR